MAIHRDSVRQIFKSLTGLIGLALFAFLFVYYAAEASKVWNGRSAGTIHSNVRRLNDSLIVFTHVDLRDFPEPPIPSVGDTLSALYDSAVTRRIGERYLNSPFPPGTELPFTFLQDGYELHGVLRMSHRDPHEQLLIWFLQIIRFLTTLLFVSVALWAFFKQPDSAGVRTLALFSFAMASFLIGSVQVMGDNFASFRVPFLSVTREILDDFSTFFSAFWLNLIFLFPRPMPFIQRRPVWAYALCYLPIVLVLIIYAVARLSGQHAEMNLGRIVLGIMTAQIFGGMILLAIRYGHAEEWIERRQMRLVLWGTGVSLTALILAIGMVFVFPAWFAGDSTRILVVVNVVFMGLLSSPISFAYAFSRYRLLEVEAKLRRGTRYMAAFIGMMGVIVVFGFLVGLILKRFIGDTGGNLALFLSVLAAFGVLPLLRGGQRFLERAFYPERQKLRQLIADFLTSAGSLADKHAFWTLLEERLREGLLVEGVYPVLRAGSNGGFLLRDHHATPFHPESELIERLERHQKPLMVDELLASRVVHLSAEETEWIAHHRVALILPLIIHHRLIGFLGLGVKTEREDYAAEELRILDSLTTQVAVATENIRLLEENVEKRRLEEQLQMARRIQHGFLPRKVPDTPGLEIAASSRFCFEVAGDYYDIIALPGGETVLAVGDVSGKGAGAALLMANLQASLRTAAGIGAPLADIVARINDLICANTPPEDYITFFVGIFDSRHRRLTYVNAGHNPPLLRRTNGTIETLYTGGIILGMTCGIAYEQETVELQSGDRLLLYTDGVSEAMNAAEEEFGEDRIRVFLEQHHCFSPSDGLAVLERSVLEFHGHAVLEDDFTLLFARIL